ncbi:MAG TPA: hypothetical protein VFL85_01190 [Candidatus Saccharimonadales bacterium]|nr:hypothetical protein [Candidatus Saccharimonadales bacterium]
MSEYGPESDNEFEHLTAALEIGTKEQAMARLIESYDAFDRLAHATKETVHTADEWIEIRQEESNYGKQVKTTFENREPGSIRIEQQIEDAALEFDIKNYGQLCSARGYKLQEAGVKLPLTRMSDTQVLLYMALLIDDLKAQVREGTVQLAFR